MTHIEAFYFACRCGYHAAVPTTNLMQYDDGVVGFVVPCPKVPCGLPMRSFRTVGAPKPRKRVLRAARDLAGPSGAAPP